MAVLFLPVPPINTDRKVKLGAAGPGRPVMRAEGGMERSREGDGMLLIENDFWEGEREW